MFKALNGLSNKIIYFLKVTIGFKTSFEAKKFLSISITKFLTVYIYTVLRGLSYSILVPTLGAELISAIELYCMFPVSSLFVILYFKLGKHFSRIKVASILLVGFIAFFAIFNIFVFPYHDLISLDFHEYRESHPRLKYTVMLIENWDIALFFMFAELWGIMMLSLSFWQLANEVSTVNEAKKYYGFFGAIGQTGLIVGGWVAVQMSTLSSAVDASNPWAFRFNLLINSVIFSGFMLLLCYWWISKNIWNHIRLDERKYSQVKMTLKESFKYVFSSRYLRLIATLIICYGILMSISETLWKSQVATLHGNASDYNVFFGKFQMYIGYGTFVGMIFAAFSLKRFSWLFNALSTPCSFLFAGVLFFSLVTFTDFFAPILESLKISPVLAAIMVGMMQIILAKSFKYSLFDLSKEMTFIPLDQELRTNGKAAVDIISNRIGKSGGSLIMLALLTIMPHATLISLSAYLFVIFIIVLLLWLHAAIELNREFEKIANANKNI